MTTNGALVGNAIFVELLGQILYLMDAGLEHVELSILIESYGQGIQVTSVETTVCQETLERNAELLSTFVPVFAVGGDEATHVHQSVFLGRHGHSVNVAVHLTCNLLDGLVGITFLSLLDEIAVLGKAGRVHHDGHTVFVAELAGLADVLH